MARLTAAGTVLQDLMLGRTIFYTLMKSTFFLFPVFQLQ